MIGIKVRVSKMIREPTTAEKGHLKQRWAREKKKLERKICSQIQKRCELVYPAQAKTKIILF